RDYLVAEGIDADRLTSKGYGESVPVSPNETDEGRALNRRVEFKLVK
ncbi:MAG: OmpA family protein, partial [bacterium]|nr:OmpA family protein [Candidatus Kapabacteria bacterium]